MRSIYQTVATYWPELVGNKQENGPLTIELLEEDTSRQPGLVTRDFQLAPSKKVRHKINYVSHCSLL